VGWDVSEKIVSAGGNIAILGVNVKSVTLHLEWMWKRNFTMTAGLVHTFSIPALMKRVLDGEIDPKKLISHHFKLSEIEKAYDVFHHAAAHKTLKVLIENDYE
jgi:alcohol dehydrogenase